MFEGAENITKIELESNQIEKVFVNTFKGLSEMKYLSLKNNFLTEILLGTFNELLNLKTLILSSNKLKSLDGKLLQFNSNLEHLFVKRNELNKIGEDILNYSLVVKIADFSDNKCIDENSEDTAIESVVDSINTHCNLPGKCGYLDFIDGNLI